MHLAHSLNRAAQRFIVRPSTMAPLVTEASALRVAQMAAGRMARRHILLILPHTLLILNGCSTRRERTRFSRHRPTSRTLPIGPWLLHTLSNVPTGTGR